MRLYEDDAYLWEIDARVVRALEIDGRPACVLDRTIFYAEGGGQASDRGTIGDAEVLDVRLAGDEVAHILSAPIEIGSARCRVDARRRYDLMQQHSGQHLLSAVLARDLGARTRSIHITDAIGGWDRPSTIDLDLEPERLGDDWIARAEEAIAAEIRRNLPITVRVVPRAEALALGLRKPPPDLAEIRVVEIEGIDRSACGGTHVRSTAEIGTVSVLAPERYKGGTRAGFLAGGRALAHAAAMRGTVADIARTIGVGPAEVAARARAIIEERDALRGRIKALEGALCEALAARLEAEGEMIAGRRACIRDLSGSGVTPALLGPLARSVADALGGVAALFTPSDAAGGVAAAIAAQGGAPSARDLLAQALPAIDGKGGGSDRFAQGKGKDARGIGGALEAVRRAIADPSTRRGS
ncbi:MAG: hypothetical protein JXP34_06395 [Planctomycetes bacterium]|nr:hypothetical protein [Planctomycetota bacterium]